MSTHAYIKLVPASRQKTVTLEEVKKLLDSYQEMTKKTGEQLGWEYKEAAFPYEIVEVNNENGSWLYLKGKNGRYQAIFIGVGQTQPNETEASSFIQITLPNGATHGDKGKANEFCKFLAKKLEGELHLFNGRIMYFYKR
ncbi:hypothetical protein GFC29_242 [Anoxybacillus sp. B7M1]|uniref:DUF1885 family protein n=1 Tax=unclassified Anoxybacillus TaxID=2639704 RepID=UPI0005CD48CD|nr:MULTISPECIES: DUF1885 family protein [unclassified Anoxybacillus]ANB58406.1 hypothetical protein GFC28_1385 [Anoxybacillus sp. B2M1]ANB65964.1 hypothetical protein GFC29_242 [Anoxybacillus sp. B7M1]